MLSTTTPQPNVTLANLKYPRKKQTFCWNVLISLVQLTCQNVSLPWNVSHFTLWKVFLSTLAGSCGKLLAASPCWTDQQTTKLVLVWQQKNTSSWRTLPHEQICRSTQHSITSSDNFCSLCITSDMIISCSKKHLKHYHSFLDNTFKVASDTTSHAGFKSVECCHIKKE